MINVPVAFVSLNLRVSIFVDGFPESLIFRFLFVYLFFLFFIFCNDIFFLSMTFQGCILRFVDLDYELHLTSILNNANRRVLVFSFLQEINWRKSFENPFCFRNISTVLISSCIDENVCLTSEKWSSIFLHVDKFYTLFSSPSSLLWVQINYIKAR